MRFKLLNIDKGNDLTAKRRKTLNYFVFVAFILPSLDLSGYSSILGIVFPNPLGYKFLAILLSLPLLCRPNFKNVQNTIVYKIVILTTIYHLIKFISTSYNVGFYNTLTVYRYSYCQCLHFVILIPFITKCTSNDLRFIINRMCNVIIIFSIIYLLDNFIFHVLSKLALGQSSSESYGGVSVMRSIIGFPPIIGGWIFFFFICMLKKIKRASLLFWISILVTFISFTRSRMLEAVIGMILIVVLLIVYKGWKYVGRSIKIFTICISVLLFANLMESSAVMFWQNKLAKTFGKELRDDVGTYNFRETLIKNAQRAISGKEIIGLGYVRDVKKGEYSMVLGGDTHIAPVLYCEGYLGLLLRVMPYVFLLIVSFLRLANKRNNYTVDIAIIALIISSALSYVQTKIIVCYPLSLMILLILKQKQYYNEREGISDEYGF